MEEIEECIRNIFTLENNKFAVDKFYEKMITFSDKEDLEMLWNNIQELIKAGKIKRDILFFALLCNNNISLLKDITNYEKSVIKLFEYSGSLYDYVVCKNKQWFELSITTDQFSEFFDKDILNILNILKLVHYTNEDLIFPEDIKVHFKDQHSFWSIYFFRIQYLWKIMKYINSAEPTYNQEQIFSNLTENSCSKTLYEYLNTKNFNHDEIVDILQKEDDMFDAKERRQSDNILSYSILFQIFNSIQDIKSITNMKDIINNLKSYILAITNKKIIINVLENIFTVLFTMTNYFIHNDEFDTFFCQESETRFILFVLKELLDEIKFKNLFNINSGEYKEFLNINKHVTNALWRIELVTQVKNPYKCQRKVLKYMLASPESLIQMCLKERDYEKAYQVVQVRFQLNFLTSM